MATVLVLEIPGERGSVGRPYGWSGDMVEAAEGLRYIVEGWRDCSAVKSTCYSIMRTKVWVQAAHIRQFTNTYKSIYNKHPPGTQHLLTSFWYLYIQVHTNSHKTYTQIINKDTLSSLVLPFPYLKEPRVRPGEGNERTFCLILLGNCCQKSLSRNNEKLGFP